MKSINPNHLQKLIKNIHSLDLKDLNYLYSFYKKGDNFINASSFDRGQFFNIFDPNNTNLYKFKGLAGYKDEYWILAFGILGAGIVVRLTDGYEGPRFVGEFRTDFTYCKEYEKDRWISRQPKNY